MNPVLKKLKLTDQDPVLIINPPAEYDSVIQEIEAEVHRQTQGVYQFVQVFVKTMDEANSVRDNVMNAFAGDGYLWVCYPKKSSKKYKSDCTRETISGLFANYNYEPVTQVAIDEDWSAMRFRSVDQIKKMDRQTAVSKKGKQRIGERL